MTSNVPIRSRSECAPECAPAPATQAILCYAIGNEIPASIVRWYGHRRVEGFLERLYRAAKAEDPDALVTYVNYPSTEYLQLPFVDFVCFNVYLEAQERLEAYLARLQNIAGERPLVLAEIGLDSRGNSEEIQARTLDWQIRTVFAAGCAGAIVFAWTDEWHRGDYDIEDWDFGLTDRDRQPKLALAVVQAAFTDVPFSYDVTWPRISVVVCSYNGAHTIRDCCEGLLKLEYPDFEVIVVDDGSTDTTAAIVGDYRFRLFSTENLGLSNARNIGMQAATGEIIAYLDDDAYPDPHWLTYLAATFLSTAHAGVGGPNIAPPGDGVSADCVANAPGGPVHVLLSDQEAEHIPGCNMAFRKANLEAIGGFDPQFRVAGDDVDICWRLRHQGWTLGYSPTAIVWHHRRSSVRAYWKQQRGYGRAEALLERKWPERYSAVGALAWAGRMYGKGLAQPLGWRRERIHHGIWGTGLFQSIYQPSPGLGSLLLMPEWHLVILALAVLSALGTFWLPLLVAAPLLVMAAVTPFVQAGFSAARASFTSRPQSRVARLKLYGLTTFLYLLQPLARLWGRMQYGLTPWRQRGAIGFSVPVPKRSTIWSKRWRAPEEWLHSIEAALRVAGATVLRGGECDRWDLEVRNGIVGSARVLMAIEEHGMGRQLVRFRVWPRCSRIGIMLIILFAALTIEAGFEGAWGYFTILGVTTALLGMRPVHECAAATAAVLHAVSAVESEGTSNDRDLTVAMLASRNNDRDITTDQRAIAEE